ncbi:hypothetical protein GQX73_g4510 [Xylaria multiplex]|uniref:Uncharacterized protein n=1 Tax=Xylaria multiplex TaxID=323545 RepID=A0A7C8ISD3_9PEZI|nr:hypothetical protein GQX73_g4510 [Xylaria multiplex]
MSSELFVIPTFALAAQFPELDPIDLLQLVEAPVVRMAFYEFRYQFWDELQLDNQEFGVRPEILVNDKMVRLAIETFNLCPGGQNRRTGGIIGGGLPSDFTTTVNNPFAVFMTRIYSWATQEHLSLPISKSFVNPTLRNGILWGILGICLDLHSEGKFPAPLAPFPKKFEINCHEDFRQWKNGVSGSLGYDASWFPAWQEWRIRHDAFWDSESRNAFISFWAEWTAGEEGFCGLGERSPAAQCEKWVNTLRFVDPENPFRLWSRNHWTRHIVFTSPRGIDMNTGELLDTA